SVSVLSGPPRCSPARSTITSWRWLGVTGLKVLSAIALSLQTRGHVDGVTLFKGHDGALGRRLDAAAAAERLGLTFADERVHALDLDVEQLLDRLLDLRLGGGAGDLEQHLVLVGGQRRLFGNHRRKHDVIVARIGRAHLNRASSASRAALVSTSC